MENKEIDPDVQAEEDAMAADEEQYMMDHATGMALMPIDQKYELAIDRQGPLTQAVMVKAGTKEPIHDWVIFRAQDKALLATLVYYGEVCSKLGSPDEHLKGVEQLIDRVKAYQDEYKVKVPD